MLTKSQSQIVSTVLLILIVITTSIIIIGFVVPFVNENLSGSDCLNVVGGVSIVNGQYTCFNESSNEINIQVHRGEVDLKGFSIVLGGASSKSYKIFPGVLEGVYPYGGNIGEAVEIPDRNEERTYIIKVLNKPDSINVYPILENDRLCESPDSVKAIDEC